MHKSSQNPSKSTENRWKLRLGLVPGALGEALGVILAPKACLRQQRDARCPKMHRKWVPIWRSIGVMFLVFWGLFFNTFFEGLRTSLFIDFGSILASILGAFLVLFLNLWISSFLQPFSSKNLIFEGPRVSFSNLFCYVFFDLILRQFFHWFSWFRNPSRNPMNSLLKIIIWAAWTPKNLKTR